MGSSLKKNELRVTFWDLSENYSPKSLTKVAMVLFWRTFCHILMALNGTGHSSLPSESNEIGLVQQYLSTIILSSGPHWLVPLHTYHWIISQNSVLELRHKIMILWIRVCQILYYHIIKHIMAIILIKSLSTDS